MYYYHFDKFYDVTIIHDAITKSCCTTTYAIVVLNVPEGNANGIFIKLFPKSQINLSNVSIK